MKTTSNLQWNPCKGIRYMGRDCILRVSVKLNDECGNKQCDFSITGSIKLTSPGNRRDPYLACGCIHEEITKYFPELKKYVPLHLCDHNGVPMYPVGNGIYHIKNSSKEIAMEYLRITEDEYNVLSLCAIDKAAFKYQLFMLGIVDRWKQEADDFISFLESKTHTVWENPYTESEERFRFYLTDEEKKDMEQKIASNFFSEENLKNIAKKIEEDALQQKRKTIIDRYNEETKKSRINRDVHLCLVNAGLDEFDAIYYDHLNELVFNWASHETSRERFERFLKEADRSLLPKDIKIKFKK